MSQSTSPPRLLFASFAEDTEQLNHLFFLAESIRRFGGRFRNADIHYYTADYADFGPEELFRRFESLDVRVLKSTAPPEALKYFFAGKVFAAATCEARAVDTHDILVWMDEDTLVLDEPGNLMLDDGVSLAYRPVIHNRSGTLYGREPVPYWKRIYRVLDIPEEKLFPMTTPADGEIINAYFNAGLLALRSGRGVLRRWAEDFVKLYRDPELAAMCEQDITDRIFLHQTPW